MSSPVSSMNIDSRRARAEEVKEVETRVRALLKLLTGFDHSPGFWGLVKRVLPDYEERKRWLEAHEVRLG